MESLTYIKNIKSTPKKLRMLRDLLFVMKPQDTLDYLKYDTSKPSKIYFKAIHSAIANASQTLNVSADMLKFKLLTIEEGRTLKRHHAGSKGMAKPILKKFSHIKIVLVSDMPPAPMKKESKGEKEKESKNVSSKTVKKEEPKKAQKEKKKVTKKRGDTKKK